jgi:hypothetical protein
MLKRFMTVGFIVLVGMATLAPAAGARPATARPVVRTARGGRINCVINKGDVKVTSLGPNRVMITGKLKVINTSYLYNYDAGAEVHVYTNRQKKFRVLHGHIQPRRYRKFPFRFVLSVYPPSTTVHWKVKRCGLY